MTAVPPVPSVLSGPSAPTGVVRLDRDAPYRATRDIWAALLGDPETLVLELRGGLAPIRTRGTGDLGADRPAMPQLALRPPVDSDRGWGSEGDGSLLLYLGRLIGADGGSRRVLARCRPEQAAVDAASAGEAPAAAPAEAWAGLRDVGPSLEAVEQELFMTATALSNWHGSHPRCPRCGTPTEPALAGWVRRCPQDGSEHYPRTDPAVIMAVLDPQDRILLGRSPAWAEGRFSVLAGFVEPGESLEAAVAREVLEEVGVVVDEVEYVASQPWPFPASLMLGYLARCRETALHLDPAEIAEARWYSRSELAAAVADRSLGLPGRLSIARRLLEQWYGGPITAPDELPWRMDP